MFSVIIPLYNKAPYVEKAIQSVLAQTCQEFELIVVDDGSKDNSLEITRRHEGTKARIIEQKNSGVSTARNNGAKVAKYDYIAFLDADDWWDIRFLEEMKTLILTYSEAAMYGSSYYSVKNGKNRIAPIALPPNFESGYIDYIKTYAEKLCMPITSITAVVKKDVFNEMHGFKPTLKLGEDFDLWLRIALKYKVAFLNKPLAYYNQDVELQNRAVGNLHKPETHMLWHLDGFEKQSDKVPYLKQLLDKLRIDGLFKYFLNNKYGALALEELKKVDWSKQPKSAKERYEKSIWYLRAKLRFMKTGSACKNFIIRLF